MALAVAASSLADRIGRLALYDPVAHGREKSRQYVANLERLLAAGELEAGLIDGLRSLLDMSDKDPGQGHTALFLAPELIAAELAAFVDTPGLVG